MRGTGKGFFPRLIAVLFPLGPAATYLEKMQEKIHG